MSVKVNVLLTTLLVGCALSVVNARYQARHLLIELERLQQHARQLDVDWDQLQLDQSRLAKNDRIEQIARSELNMAPLTPARTQYLTEGAPGRAVLPNPAHALLPRRALHSPRARCSRCVCPTGVPA